MARQGGNFRRSRLVIPTDERLRAYIAGLIDGEGCITRANGRLLVQIGMTDETVIRWLGQIGGTIRVEDGPGRGNRKPLYRWRVMAGDEVRRLLRSVLPYLIVKRAQAGDAICEIEGRFLVLAGEA